MSSKRIDKSMSELDLLIAIVVQTRLFDLLVFHLQSIFSQGHKALHSISNLLDRSTDPKEIESGDVWCWLKHLRETFAMELRMDFARRNAAIILAILRR